MQLLFFSTLNIINALCSGLSIVISLIFLRKDYKNWLNRLLFLTFFCWGINILFYSFVFLSDLGIEFVNLIRDINAGFGIISAFCLFLSGIYLVYGEDVALTPKNIFIIAVMNLLVVIIGLSNDKIGIQGGISYIQTNLLGNIAIFGISSLLALIGLFLFFQTYRRLEEPIMKKQVLYFMIGAGLLIMGALFFGIDDFIPPLQIFFYLGARLLWIISPLCLIWGLYFIKPEMP